MPGPNAARSYGPFLRYIYDQLTRERTGPTNPQTGQPYPVSGGGFGDFAAQFRPYTQKLGEATSPIVGQAADFLLGMATPGAPVEGSMQRLMSTSPAHKFGMAMKSATAAEEANAAAGFGRGMARAAKEPFADLKNVGKARALAGEEVGFSDMVSKAGGQYVGIQNYGKAGRAIMFNEPKTGSTTVVMEKDLSPENIIKKLAEVRQRFGLE